MAASGTANKKRLVILRRFLALLFALLMGRLFYVQVIWGPELQEKALLQWTKDSSLSAQRGRILDRDGQVLAQSGTAYQVQVNPSRISPTSLQRVAKELSNVLGMEYDTVLMRINDPKKQQVILKRQVEREQIEQLMALDVILGKCVSYGVDSKRYYPMGPVLAQTLGFTNVDGIGQEGLERSYNSALAGESGRLIAETDRQNKPLAYGTQEYIPPVNGSELMLTVDIVIQAILENAMEEALTANKAKSVQGLVMDVNTAELLAVSVKPDFDPNAPPRDNLEELLSLVKMRVASDAFEPGEPFEIITLSAALDSGTVRRTDTFTCKGYWDADGERVLCVKDGHGQQTAEEALCGACNSAFVQMALGMGADALYDYIYRFGFGASTDSGLMGESSGIVIHQKYVRPVSLAHMAYGESIAVTPVQLAAAVSAVVNGGSLMQPTIVKQVQSEDGVVLSQNDPRLVRQVIKADTSAQMCALLETAVEKDTTKVAQVPGYRVGGLGGTGRRYESGVVKEGSLISTYVGFAPVEDPRYLVLILVEEPQVRDAIADSVAAPFVRTVLQETLLHYGVKPSASADRVQIPNVVGISASDAAQSLESSGLSGKYAEDERNAPVRAQAPAAGSFAAKGTRVLLYTSESARDPAEAAEQAMVKVPDVLKKTRLQAYDLLAEAGLELRIEPKEQSGVAVRQKPEAGTEVPVGEKVLVDFSPVSGTE